MIGERKSLTIYKFCVKEEDLKMASRNVVENPKLLSEGRAEQEGICSRSEVAERLVWVGLAFSAEVEIFF